LSNGQYRQRDPEHSIPQIAKGWWIERKQRRQAAHESAKLTKMAESAAWNALMGAAGPEVIMPREPKESEDAVLRALAKEPRTVDELVELTGLSKATVYRRLNRYGQENDGQPGAVRKLVTGPDAGKYALTRPGEGAAA
jgi:DNA-binding NtrC family response regulator